jgi:CxxC motif-containing protein
VSVVEKNKKPKLPDGMREIPVGEPVKAGDLKWDPAAKKCREIVQTVNISVTTPREGWYCRKIE